MGDPFRSPMVIIAYILNVSSVSLVGHGFLLNLKFFYISSFLNTPAAFKAGRKLIDRANDAITAIIAFVEETRNFVTATAETACQVLSSITSCKKIVLNTYSKTYVIAATIAAIKLIFLFSPLNPLM